MSQHQFVHHGGDEDEERDAVANQREDDAAQADLPVDIEAFRASVGQCHMLTMHTVETGQFVHHGTDDDL